MDPLILVMLISRLYIAQTKSKMKQQHTLGIYESIKCFQPTMWESRCLPWREVQVALSWREIGVGWLVRVFIRHSFLNRDNILEGPFHSRDACFRITYRLGPT